MTAVSINSASTSSKKQRGTAAQQVDYVIVRKKAGNNITEILCSAVWICIFVCTVVGMILWVEILLARRYHALSAAQSYQTHDTQQRYMKASSPNSTTEKHLLPKNGQASNKTKTPGNLSPALNSSLSEMKFNSGKRHVSMFHALMIPRRAAPVKVSHHAMVKTKKLHTGKHVRAFKKAERFRMFPNRAGAKETGIGQNTRLALPSGTLPDTPVRNNSRTNYSKLNSTGSGKRLTSHVTTTNNSATNVSENAAIPKQVRVHRYYSRKHLVEKNNASGEGEDLSLAEYFYISRLLTLFDFFRSLNVPVPKHSLSTSVLIGNGSSQFSELFRLRTNSTQSGSLKNRSSGDCYSTQTVDHAVTHISPVYTSLIVFSSVLISCCFIACFVTIAAMEGKEVLKMASRKNEADFSNVPLQRV